MAEEEVDYGVEVEDDEWRYTQDHLAYEYPTKAPEDDDVISLDDGGGEPKQDSHPNVAGSVSEGKPSSRQPPTGPRHSVARPQPPTQPRQHLTSSQAPAPPAVSTKPTSKPSTTEKQGVPTSQSIKSPPRNDDRDLPEGWTRLYGRTDKSEFFWHKASNKTTRERPTGPPAGWQPANDTTGSKDKQGSSSAEKVPSDEARKDAPSAPSADKKIPTGPSASEARPQTDIVASAYSRRKEQRPQTTSGPLIDRREDGAPTRRPRSRSPPSRGNEKRARRYDGRNESPPLSAKLAARDMELDKRRPTDRSQGPPQAPRGYGNGNGDRRDLPPRSPPTYRTSEPFRPRSAASIRPNDSAPSLMPRSRSPRINDSPARVTPDENVVPSNGTRRGAPAPDAARPDAVLPPAIPDAFEVRPGSLLARMNRDEDPRARLRREAQEAEEKLKRIREEEARLELEETERKAVAGRESLGREDARTKEMLDEKRSSGPRGPADRGPRDVRGPRSERPPPIAPPRHDDAVRPPGWTPAMTGDTYRPISPPPGGPLASRLSALRPLSPRRDRRSPPPFYGARPLRGSSPPPSRDGPPFDTGRRNEYDRYAPPPRDFRGPPPGMRDDRPPFRDDRPLFRDDRPPFRDEPPRRLEERIRPRDFPPDSRSRARSPPMSRPRSPPPLSRGPSDRFDMRRLERPLAERMSSDSWPRHDSRDRDRSWR
ncbi:hypothetical protein BCR39DRAFT_529753 [Naematelia encephala]|uniref:WW domain-containing protein n=1 Tax=Naematelia encephala TaxID=71784 RepID=A0A1Y2B6D8_9TREE|nr:hypothetical protein BCR39DRAFT_529753 [Naematelia encephala]